MTPTEPELELESELSALLQAALRAETPPGLSAEQHAQLMATAQVEPRRPDRRRLRAALAACACALVFAGYLGVAELRDRELSAQRAALQEEQQRQAQQVIEQREAALARERAAAERDHERAMAAAAAEAASACRAEPSAGSKSGDVRQERPFASPSRRKSSSGKASSGSKAGLGSCDPNDPLCGL